MKRRTGGLWPVGPYDYELLDKYPFDKELQFEEPKQRRSNKHHNLYWKLLTEIVNNSEEWMSKDELHDAIVVETGYYTVQRLLDGGTMVKPESISFARMGQEKFNIYWDRAMAVLNKAGKDTAAYLREIKQETPYMIPEDFNSKYFLRAA